MSWRKTPRGDRVRRLPHGLVLRIWREPDHPRAGAPQYAISVFGQRLVTPSETTADAKRRAEDAARRWMHEALLKLSMGE